MKPRMDLGSSTAPVLAQTIETVACAGDPYNLLLLAIPMYLLYELGILLARFVPRRPTAA
jgi:Sec-independent protein secretion pathway component TatC